MHRSYDTLINFYLKYKIMQHKELDLYTLEWIKTMFTFHSDFSTKCNGYKSLCRLIKEAKTSQFSQKIEPCVIGDVIGRSKQLICPICGLDGFKDQADLDIHLENCED